MISDRLRISAKVLADSHFVNSRITTFELTFPRFILAEFNTHRVLSRNSASSRAIPVWKRLVELSAHPFVPLHFGRNKAGMQSAEMIPDEINEHAKRLWLSGRDFAIAQAYMLVGGREQVLADAKGDSNALGVCDLLDQLAERFKSSVPEFTPLPSPVHKQHANRVLEPYAWHTVIATGTRWRNFYALRASAMAQPEIQMLAIEMARAHRDSNPKELAENEWHLPFITEEDRRDVGDEESLARISSARCARVSYLTHDGLRNIDKDLSMAGSLQSNGHMSPFEHPAQAWWSMGHLSNFGKFWAQFREFLPDESDFSRMISREDFTLGMRQDESLVDFVLSLPE